MVYYWLILSIPLICSLIKLEEYKNLNSFFWFLFSFILIIFLGFRSDVGGDWYVYTNNFHLTGKNFNFNSALFVYDPAKLDENFKRASHNIPKVSLLSQSGINVKDLIHHEKIFIVKDSINVISKRLS